ncbi:16S/23S rRNA (cytidine-2'-O)-methyltransferase TlyA [Rickettsiales bacterium Ac37b]|nr:16S/23S rRNA (cytidine-2'-O)-methyltransferase TlyA [Rickettsiales bacterium Ac37b]
MKKKLSDILINRGLAQDEKSALALVMAGYVYTDEGKCLNKIGGIYYDDINLTLKLPKNHKWVSRAAIKLDHALKIFNLEIKNMIAIDIGCSTGGFTQVLLEYGANKVYAVDVAYGEIDWRLRNNSKIHLLERTNARYLTSSHIPELVDLIVCDASFIGLTTVIYAAMKLTKEQATLVALIKPQFEVAKDEVGKGGIVRDAHLHQIVINRIKSWFNEQNGWCVQEVIESPITGMEGNKEFLIMVTKN